MAGFDDHDEGKKLAIIRDRIVGTRILGALIECPLTGGRNVGLSGRKGGS